MLENYLESKIVEQSRLIAEEMKNIVVLANSEEDIRYNCNKLIDNFLKTVGISIRGCHEYGLAGGHIDSKYGGVIIEYKNPKGANKISTNQDSFGTKALIAQIQGRFDNFGRIENLGPERIFGVGCDGSFLVFVRYRRGNFEPADVQPVTSYSVQRLLRALVSLGIKGKSFRPELLAQDFGADSALARSGIKKLWEILVQTKSNKAKVFFSQWKLLFGEVCGYNIEGQNTKFQGLYEHYEIPTTTLPSELLFSLHTYYAIFMKFLAAETALSFSRFGTSMVQKCLSAATPEKMLLEMKNLEEGGIWSKIGVTNFLEGDIFSWYLDCWNGSLANVVLALARTLSEYEITTLSIEPDENHDLLKKLYQRLFPKSVRHDLGEYYTPDWLAEHVLEHLGYDGQPDKRILDPACGSGTFLVVAINRIKKWFIANLDQCGFDETELVKKILQNVVGFDLNPLAVMAARTNYLLSIADLLQFTGSVEIPVYLCDSIFTPARYDDLFVGFGKVKKFATSVGDFLIPNEISSTSKNLATYTATIESCLKNKYPINDFLARCTQEGLSVNDIQSHQNLYECLRELDSKGENGQWARIIKNAFAPLFVKKVDYVIGNPPWVRWGYLPDSYRNDTQSLWRYYDLFLERGLRAKMGTGELDFSMLFLYCCADTYLSDNGLLGFLITEESIKSKSAGRGFRKFNIPSKNIPLGVYRVDDFTSFNPFEASNKTISIYIRKNCQTQYPVEYFVWRVEKGTTYVSGQSDKPHLSCMPYKAKFLKTLGDPWQVTEEGSNLFDSGISSLGHYRGRRGASIDPYGVYYLEILEERASKVLVTNHPELGKNQVIQKLISPLLVDAEHVYPAIRGRDIKRWGFNCKFWVLIPNLSIRRQDWLTERDMRQ